MRLPTVGRVSTAVAPSGLSSSVGEEALAVLRELTGRPDAVFREGQDVAVAALVEKAQRALVVQRTGWGKSAVYFVSTALLQARGVNLLVLDEPTNHLDLPAIEQLEQALDSFPGTLLLVSHDRRLLDAVRLTRRLHVEDGALTEVPHD